MNVIKHSTLNFVLLAAVILLYKYLNFASIENGAKGKCAVFALWVTLGGWGWSNCSWGLPTDGPSSNKAVFRIIQYSRGHRTRKIPYALDCVWVWVMPMVPCAIRDEDQHSIQTGNPEEGSGRSFPTIVKGQRNREATLPAAPYLNFASIHSFSSINKV